MHLATTLGVGRGIKNEAATLTDREREQKTEKQTEKDTNKEREK